ncbi:type II/IV secretion system ATPase subunit [Candidatus Woesearchaeota archaeon]|nr:type II/IV secretion system ATPase subunit [Candidatus Woesearchaeota archaeon]
MPEKRGDCFSYETYKEGEDLVLRIDAETCPFFPSIEASAVCMSAVIDKLVQNPSITRVVFTQKRDYEYDYGQVSMLAEIGKLRNQIIKQQVLFTLSSLGGIFTGPAGERRSYEIRNIVYNKLRNDPVAAYVELRRMHREEKVATERAAQPAAGADRYLQLVESLLNALEKTELMLKAKPHLQDYKEGDRGIYRYVFNPLAKPDFMFTRLMAAFPQDGEEIDSYTVEGADITLFKLPSTVQYLYHVVPPEFKLTEDKYELLDSAKRIISEHKPTRSEFIDPERVRQVFFNVGSDLIEELADQKQLKLRTKEVEELAEILVRYTIGFGLIEVLLKDDKIQDITANSPMGRQPLFIVHQDYDDCMTNIIPTSSDADSWATKLRLMSGRPLDEANPILDTELLVPGARARVAVVGEPLNPNGLAYAFRRHRDKPWTFPLFIKQRMMTPLSAGLLSFLIDGSRTMLVAGTRSAGKTSVLGSVMVEIMRKYRILSIEDTLELPVAALKQLNYNIQSMKVASALTKGTTEVSADEGIRSTLRMGDSCLIIGEVRSLEAQALYEAMRVGALANVVAGTIHGDSPYGVFDRVVNDLRVPRTSFKATDVIVVANPIRTPDGLHRWRRLTQITEVGKYWENDPLLEKGFKDLMKYDSKSDQLEPTIDLLNGESDVLKSIAANVKDWAGSWDAVWDNILLRAQVKEAIVDAADKTGQNELLEAPFVVQANDEFHKLAEEVKDELGSYDNKRIFFEWNEWLKKAVKRKEIEVV